MLKWKNKLHKKTHCGIPDLIVKADKTGPQFCLDNADNIDQTFIPIGSLVSDPSRMVYEAKNPGSKGHKWYFYDMTSGEWEFTWDAWLKPSDIDFNNYGRRKLKSINAAKIIFLNSAFETPYKDPTSEFETILEKWQCVKKIQEVFEQEDGSD